MPEPRKTTARKAAAKKAPARKAPAKKVAAKKAAPRKAPAKKLSETPWNDWKRPTEEGFNEQKYYGPPPDSPEGIRAATLLNEIVGQRLREALSAADETQATNTIVGDGDFSVPRITLTAFEQLLRVVNFPGVEPPRLYVVQRTNKIVGTTTFRAKVAGSWTQDLLQAEMLPANLVKVPEDDDVRDQTKEAHYAYAAQPVDSLVWAIQSAARIEDIESIFAGNLASSDGELPVSSPYDHLANRKLVNA